MPAGVHVVRHGAKTHYYWAPGRGTPHAGPRVVLGTDPTSPAFWVTLAQCRATTAAGAAAGTWGALNTAWAASREWAALSAATRSTFRTAVNPVRRVR